MLAGGDRAEAHVDERLALARRGLGNLRAAKAQRPRRQRDRRVLERLWDRGEIRGPLTPDGAVGHRLDGGHPEPHARDRDAVLLGHQRRRRLPAVADDQVRPPVAGERAQTRKHRPYVEHAEELGDHSLVPFVELHPRERRQQRHPLLVGRRTERRERQAGACDVRLEAVLRGDEHIVTGAPTRRRIWDQGPQVARATACGEEDAHC
jgi:hypothetical protein